MSATETATPEVVELGDRVRVGAGETEKSAIPWLLEPSVDTIACTPPAAVGTVKVTAGETGIVPDDVVVTLAGDVVSEFPSKVKVTIEEALYPDPVNVMVFPSLSADGVA